MVNQREWSYNLLIVVLAFFEPRLANDAMLHFSLSNSKIFQSIFMEYLPMFQDVSRDEWTDDAMTQKKDEDDAAKIIMKITRSQLFIN